MPTVWCVHHGDLLDVPADVLICSANVFLTLSGGVGGALMLRYGSALQDAMTGHLSELGVKHVARGDVVAMPSLGTPYRAVLHAVAVDGFYETTVDITVDVLRKSLQRAAEFGAESVAVAALATGYGRKPIEFFAAAVNRVITEDFAPVRRVVVGLRSRHEVDDLRAAEPRIKEE